MREQGGLFQQMVLGILRHVLTALAGYFVAEGLFSQELVEPIVAGGVALGMVGWSLFEKHRSNALNKAKTAIIEEQKSVIKAQTNEIRSLQ